MTQAWYIDDSKLEVKIRVNEVDLVIDGGAASATIPNGIAGRFAVPWKRRDVEVRRVGPSRGLETEVWIDEIYVPTGTKGPSRGKVAECDAHGKRSSRRCPECDRTLCRRCTAIDGVRCDACFDAKATSERTKRKRAWLIGAAFCLVVALLCFWGGAVTDTDILPKAAGTLLFGAIFMAWTGLRRRDSRAMGIVHPSFHVDDEPPQVVGQKCAACEERVGTAKDAAWCARCRKPHHERCLDGHACKRPARGPDWRALQTS